MKTPERKLRIAMMLDSDGPGGAEMMVFRLSEDLRRRGHSVIPVLPRDGVGWLGDLFRGAGYSPETFWLKRPIDPTAVGRLMGLFRQHAIDVVHSHEFTMAVYGSTAARLHDVPHLMTMHGGLTITNALRRRIALRWAIRCSGHAIAVSKATALQFAKDLGLPSDAFAVVHNGVPLESGRAERVRAEFGGSDNEIVILAVGNLERNKNHRMLLEALVRLERNGLGAAWRLIIAGGRGGEEDRPLRDYIQSQRLDDRVHLVTGRSDIADLQSFADVFAMPSLREGMPMALLEAMVAGKAIVASATGGIPEAVVDGREAILVQPGDVDSLARGLHTLISDEVKRRALGAAARARARQEFTVQVMADRYLDLYTRMCNWQS